MINFILTFIYLILLLIVGKVVATFCQLLSITPTIGGIIVIVIMAFAIYYLHKLKARIIKRKG